MSAKGVVRRPCACRRERLPPDLVVVRALCQCDTHLRPACAYPSVIHFCARRAVLCAQRLCGKKVKMASSQTEPLLEPNPSEPTPSVEGRPEPTVAPPALTPADAVQEAASLVATYANFARVTGSPEELILDFGLNPQPIGPQTKPVLVTQRVIMHYFTAKRLLGALSMSVQRHEQVFGALQTDINKRVTLPRPRPER